MRSATRLEWIKSSLGLIGNTIMDLDELLEWFGFFSKLILECICITAWTVLAWWIHGHLARVFPLEGVAKLMFQTLEILFYSSTIYHLIKLLFWPQKKRQNQRW